MTQVAGIPRRTSGSRSIAHTLPVMREHTVVGGGGVPLHVVEAGAPDGPALLLLHGWSQSWLAWAAQFRGGLAGDHRLVAWDMRGHGRSGRPDVATGYADPALWAADLHAVLTGLDLHRPVVSCWSYGGVVVCDYLAAHGPAALGGINLVGAITELGTPVAAATVGAEFLAAARDSYAADVATCLAGIDGYLDLVVGSRVATLTDAERAELLGSNVRVPPAVRRALFRRRVEHTCLLAALDLPVLVTHGAEDRVVLPAAGRRHAAAVPGATLSVYPGIGHAPFAEAPERFDGELRAFAARCAR